MINLYVLHILLSLKRKGLSDARVAPLFKKEYGFDVHIL